MAPTQGAPKVSVSLITYKHERYIAKAIESALAQQTDFAFEIVIGDDLSPDGTSAIVQRYAEAHPAIIRVVPRTQNLGLVHNAIHNIKQCRGQYIALLEGDDYWTDSNKLQAQVDLLDARPDLAFCFTNSVNYFEDSGQSEVLYKEPLPATISLEEFLLRNINIPNNTKMFRASAMPKSLPEWYYTVHVWDWLLHIFMAESGHMGYLHLTTLLYNRHSGAFIINMAAEKSLRDGLFVTEKLRKHFNGKYAEVWSRTWWNYEELALIELERRNYGRFLVELWRSFWPLRYWKQRNFRDLFWKIRRALRAG